MPWVWCAAGLSVILAAVPPGNEWGLNADGRPWMTAELAPAWQETGPSPVRRCLTVQTRPTGNNPFPGIDDTPTEFVRHEPLPPGIWCETMIRTLEEWPEDAWKVDWKVKPKILGRTRHHTLTVDLLWLAGVPLLWSAAWIAWRLRPARRAAPAAN